MNKKNGVLGFLEPSENTVVAEGRARSCDKEPELLIVMDKERNPYKLSKRGKWIQVNKKAMSDNYDKLHHYNKGITHESNWASQEKDVGHNEIEQNSARNKSLEQYQIVATVMVPMMLLYIMTQIIARTIAWCKEKRGNEDDLPLITRIEVSAV
jgi:hypothetical protein